jgi:hypothetical protein
VTLRGNDCFEKVTVPDTVTDHDASREADCVPVQTVLSVLERDGREMDRVWVRVGDCVRKLSVTKLEDENDGDGEGDADNAIVLVAVHDSSEWDQVRVTENVCDELTVAETDFECLAEFRDGVRDSEGPNDMVTDGLLEPRVSVSSTDGLKLLDDACDQLRDQESLDRVRDRVKFDLVTRNVKVGVLDDDTVEDIDPVVEGVAVS